MAISSYLAHFHGECCHLGWKWKCQKLESPNAGLLPPDDGAEVKELRENWLQKRRRWERRRPPKHWWHLGQWPRLPRGKRLDGTGSGVFVEGRFDLENNFFGLE